MVDGKKIKHVYYRLIVILNFKYASKDSEFVKAI